MVNRYDGWEVIGEALGEGGQGKVYKARSPKRVDTLRQSVAAIEQQLRQVNHDPSLITGLAKLLTEVGSPDDPKDFGALKVFKIPDGNLEEKSKALARLQAEVKALMELKHPAVLRFLHAPHMAVEEHFLVTEYHPNGTLEQHLATFKGRALESLEAFRPLVEGIVAIHEKGAIHRDIKTQNIFVATDGRLVLGDFGIVFFRDAARTRYTETFGERIGSHYWMAPWAYEPERLALEQVSPPLDIFPLAKVLWSMIAGRNGPPFQDYARREYNLEVIFPRDQAMPIVNGILSKCIVRDEEQCLKSAGDLLQLIDMAMKQIRNVGERPDGDGLWRCRVCGEGHYRQENMRTTTGYEVRPGVLAGSHRYAAFICDVCKHCQFFRE